MNLFKMIGKNLARINKSQNVIGRKPDARVETETKTAQVSCK